MCDLWFCLRTGKPCSGQMPLSPEIHADKTVTFRCMAPGAHKVQITGDFLPTKKIDTPMGKYDMPGVADLKKDEKGVWSFTTTAPLAPELYSYTMMVDGAKCYRPSQRLYRA